MAGDQLAIHQDIVARMGTVSAVRRRRAATVWLLALVLATLTALTGCGATAAGVRPAVAAGVTPTAAGQGASVGVAATRTVGPDAYERSGRTGDLRLVLPPTGTREPYPLVIALHSLFHDSTETSAWGLAQLARTDGFALASPKGIDGSWDAGSCCDQAAKSKTDDVGWLRAVIQHLETNYPIDPARVVLVGLSNGGMMAYRYACEHPEDLAGIAVVAGSLQQSGCQPGAPVTVVSVHGGADAHVPDAGIAWQPALATAITSTTDSLAPFRSADRCAPATAGATLPTGADGAPRISDTVGARDAAVTPAELASGEVALQAVDPVKSPPDALHTETTCSTGARVVEYYLPLLGHGWPATTGTADFDTAEVIWQLLGAARAR
jgi:poly(3-hydroxybutyrate) depolymerase